jgi:Dimerisation domain
MDYSATVKASVAASAERIQDLMANVPPALAMLAGMQLEVFTSLGDGVRDAADLASALGVAEEPLSRLLYALVVCGLLERREGGFANSSETANFLVKGLPGYLGGMHELLDQLWRADLETAQSLRLGRPAPCTISPRRRTSTWRRCCAGCTRARSPLAVTCCSASTFLAIGRSPMSAAARADSPRRFAMGAPD